MSLTPKRERFCQSIVSGMNQSDAYRASYDCENMLDATISNNAYMLVNKSDIKARIAELKLPIAEQVGRTLKQHIEKLQELAAMAAHADQFNASIKAEENIGKVLGYYITKTELTGKDGGPVEHKIVREIIDKNDNK